MGMGHGMNLNHGRHDVARDEGVTHAFVRLGDAVTDVANGEDAWLATCLEDPVADFFDQWAEVKRSRMPHAIGAIDQDLRLGKVVFGPIHP